MGTESITEMSYATQVAEQLESLAGEVEEGMINLDEEIDFLVWTRGNAQEVVKQLEVVIESVRPVDKNKSEVDVDDVNRQLSEIRTLIEDGLIDQEPWQFFTDELLDMCDETMCDTEVGADGVAGCQHEWVVFSTALAEVCLMLQCAECGLHGTVDDPSAEEWNQAFTAPEEPYQWHDHSRVTVRGRGDLYIEKCSE